MANGKHGDHPLTDILQYGKEVYGPETDDLIRKIDKLASRQELNDWWAKEIGWTGDKQTARQKAQQYYEELRKRAKDSGWEAR